MTKLDVIRALYWVIERIEPADYSGNVFAAVELAAETIGKSARALQRIAERECNGIERYDATARRVLAQWTDADQARADKQREKAQCEAMEAFAALFGDMAADCVEFQSDPRGAPIRFYIGGRSESRSPDAYFS